MYDFLYSISDFVGILGVVLLLTAYFSLSTGRLSSDRMLYQILNFVAAWLILFSLFFHWNTPSAIIEFSWITISVMGMIKILKKVN